MAFWSAGGFGIEKRMGGAFWLCLGAGFASALHLLPNHASAGYSDALVGRKNPPGASSPAPSSTESTPATGEPGRLAAPVPFDVVGLRLGMSHADALALVRARSLDANGKPAPFELVRARRHQPMVQGQEPPPLFLNLSNAKAVLAAFDLSEETLQSPAAAQGVRVQRFLANGQFESIVLQFPNVPNELRVSAIARFQRVAPPAHPDTVRRALIEKYGASTIDETSALIWLTDDAGGLVPATGKSRMHCRGPVALGGDHVHEYDHTIAARPGCRGQLTVFLQGTQQAVVAIHTVLFDHQQLIDEREAVKNTALSQFGLTPEQTQRVPAPQF